MKTFPKALLFASTICLLATVCIAHADQAADQAKTECAKGLDGRISSGQLSTADEQQQWLADCISKYIKTYNLLHGTTLSQDSTPSTEITPIPDSHPPETNGKNSDDKSAIGTLVSHLSSSDPTLITPPDGDLRDGYVQSLLGPDDDGGLLTNVFKNKKLDAALVTQDEEGDVKIKLYIGNGDSKNKTITYGGGAVTTQVKNGATITHEQVSLDDKDVKNALNMSQKTGKTTILGKDLRDMVKKIQDGSLPTNYITEDKFSGGFVTTVKDKGKTIKLTPTKTITFATDEGTISLGLFKTKVFFIINVNVMMQVPGV